MLANNPELEDSPDLDNLVKAKREEIISKLPTECVLEISCEKDDLEDYILDELTDSSDWFITSFNYDIIEVK